MTVRFLCQQLDISGRTSARPTHISSATHTSFCS